MRRTASFRLVLVFFMYLRSSDLLDCIYLIDCSFVLVPTVAADASYVCSGAGARLSLPLLQPEAHAQGW